MPRRRPFSSLFDNKLRQQCDEKDSRVFIPITIREPVPLERGRPSLTDLPDNVVQRILEFIQDLGTDEILTVALLSSSLYAGARYIQHSVVHIDLDKSRHARDRLDLIMHRGLLPAIRKLEVSGSHHDELREEDKEILSRLADMLPSITGLRDLEWKVGRTTAVPIPASILEPLPSRLRLHTCVICKNGVESHVQAREFLAHLANNQNLFTLSVQVSFISEQECLGTMRALRNLLLSCPNLRRLPLIDVWYPRDHGIGYGPGPGAPYCGLGLSDGERPPALEELGVAGYPWGRESRQTGGIYCLGYPEKGAEWDYWAETFDWSRLLRLNDIPSDLASLIAPKLTRLKELMFEERFDLRWDKTGFLNEITSPLELLSIPSWDHTGKNPGTITRHGAGLRKLKIHQLELLWTTDSCVTDRGLAQLSNGLPRLEELAIDIARDRDANDWPYKALDAIAKFPCLRTVELWFRLSDGYEPAPAKPILTISSARHLFSYLRERNQKIQRLILHSGAPSPSPFTFDGQPSWAVQNSSTLVCNMVYDGDAEEGCLSVTCPSLSKELNARLDRLARGGSSRIVPAELDEESLPLHVALDGPLSVDQWLDWRGRQYVRRRKTQREQTSMLGRFIIGPLKRAWR